MIFWPGAARHASLAAMIATFLFPLLLSLAPAQVADHPVMPARSAVILAQEDQGVGRGLRNLLVGGLVGGVGLGFLLSAGLLLMAGFLGAALLYAFLPGIGPAAAAPLMGVTGLVCTGLMLAGLGGLVAGLFWGGINGLQLLARLSPDYKPGPANDYLPM